MGRRDEILGIRGLRYRWPGAGGFELSVPRLDVRSGETVLLLGESGSGKSTLLSLICGIMRPDAGEIRVDGQDITRLAAGRRDRFRAERIGIIFQQFNLLPFGTVADNVLLPLAFAPERRARAGNAQAEVTKLLDALSLPPGSMKRRADRLSVGQQQRVAVARALIGAPPLLIADEPTSALDADSRSAFLDLLFEQLGATRSTLLMVSHDAQLGARFDRVIRMDELASKAVA